MDGVGNGRLYANVLECKEVSLPIKYLGLPFGAKYKNSLSWEPVVEMYERRLASWKRKFLSKGGRLTLIKSTMANLPKYYLSTLTIPVSIAKKLESIQCKLLWGDEEDNRKFHLVKWEEVKKPLKDGSLGIRSIVELNVALQGKWLWRFLHEDDKLWRKIVKIRWD